VLPAASDQVEVNEATCKEICDALGSISDELRDAEVLFKQACHQPVILKEGRRAKNSGPLLGPTGLKGVLLATGHDSWGVHNAPATGLLISEAVFEGSAKSADIRSLDPRTILQKALLV
jgi:glycine/D-amino acid oxidase-like deaminating enzyme